MRWTVVTTNAMLSTEDVSVVIDSTEGIICTIDWIKNTSYSFSDDLYAAGFKDLSLLLAGLAEKCFATERLAMNNFGRNAQM